MKINEKLAFLMLLSKAESVVARRFHSQGLGFMDVMVLHAIVESPQEKTRSIDLAEQVGLTASGVTRLLVPLEKLGVVKRMSNEHDARSNYIVLTNSGKTMLNDAVKHLEERCEDLFPSGNHSALKSAGELLRLISK